MSASEGGGIAHRAQSVLQRMAAAELDALVVGELSNIRWLTGFTGSNGWVVLGPDGMTLVTDGRYTEQAEAQIAASGAQATVRIGLTAAAILGEVASAARSAGTVGFEAAHLTVAGHARLAELMGGRVGELRPTTGVVEAGRRAKDPAEIEAIAEACRIADQALAEIAPTLGDGRTEAEVRNDLEYRMCQLGAQGPSYDTIVATGPVHGARPHHRPTAAPIEPGHLVVIDVGALVDGYHSDMTRTFCVGQPSAVQQELYDLVLAAQCAGVAAVRAGLSSRELDAVCRDVIADAGYGPWFSHGTGHGVGLDIHEEPFHNLASTAELVAGDVVTVEPGVYRGGFGGIRIEDLVVVTSDGCRVLTNTPKDSPCPRSQPTT